MDITRNSIAPPSEVPVAGAVASHVRTVFEKELTPHMAITPGRRKAIMIVVLLRDKSMDTFPLLSCLRHNYCLYDYL